jgi:hypothetical protein
MFVLYPFPAFCTFTPVLGFYMETPTAHACRESRTWFLEEEQISGLEPLGRGVVLCPGLQNGAGPVCHRWGRIQAKNDTTFTLHCPLLWSQQLLRLHVLLTVYFD